MTDHTPGPWIVNGYDVLDANMHQVAATNFAPRDYEECRANAAVIARAPDLLTENEVLKRAIMRNWSETFEMYTFCHFCEASADNTPDQPEAVSHEPDCIVRSILVETVTRNVASQ
jgi:hypothetical protein